ncbi:exodeoxyribonuclease VII large subunit [Idiomarina seosinensis]|uniref:exodeoxyribonuclease VII large subunit n=1 Tax=Idiomarina seosinensis TaxID=281739 RepID=UPI00384D82DE
MDVYSVSKLNNDIRRTLEQGFGNVWLVGEVSNFAAPGSGHWYFTLKDEKAQIRCAMFRGNNQRAKVRPQNGVQVLVRARVTVYAPRGDYQLLVEHIEDAGQGLLQQRFEELKVKLAAEGLFANERKRPLPADIRRVGVVTSPTGAAIQDILAVMKRRDPQVEVVIYPSSVQGESAIPQLQHMLRSAFNRNEVDVLIVGRGGGSIEDLWCFNDEQVARLLLDAPMPVISAVGHEIDFTICDFVADLRAPTPSSAAEVVTKDRSQSAQQISALQQRLVLAQQRKLKAALQQWQHLQLRLQQQHPQRQLQQQSQRSDELQARAVRALTSQLQQLKQRHQYLLGRLQALHPEKELLRYQNRLNEAQQRLTPAINRLLKQKGEQQRALMQALNIVSPLNTLDRGYAIVRDSAGNVIRDSQQAPKGTELSVKLAKGELKARSE